MTSKFLKMTILAAIAVPQFAFAKIQTVFGCNVLNDKNISTVYLYLYLTNNSTAKYEGFTITLQDKYNDRENVHYTFADKMSAYQKSEFRRQEIAEFNASEDRTPLAKLAHNEPPSYNVAFNYERSNEGRTKGRLYKKELKVNIDRQPVINIGCKRTNTLPVISNEENKASNVAYQKKNSKVVITASVTTREMGCEREEMEGNIDLTHVALDPVYEEAGMFSKEFVTVDQSEFKRNYAVRCDILGERYVADE